MQSTSGRLTTQVAHSLLIALLAVPAVIVAHRLTAGPPVPAATVALVFLAVLVAALAIPSGTRRGLTVATVAGQVAGHAVLAAAGSLAGASGHAPGGCLRVVGYGAEAGVRLAALAPGRGCPTGTHALTAGTTAAVWALLAGAAVIAGQVVVAGLTACAIRDGRDTLDRAAAAVAALAQRLAAPLLLLAPAPVVTAPVRIWPSAGAADPRPANQWVRGVQPWRGPPPAG